MATHIFTSAAANYLPKARVLASSIRQFHPDWKIHLVLCDERPPGFSDPFHFDRVWELTDLDIPNLKSWLFEHTLVEASTAVKGFGLRKLLALPDCDHVLYFDPDIVVLSSLDQLIREFDKSSILLTPHLAEPETTQQAIVDNELSVLQHGIYNLGFVGVRNSPEGHRFADWWCQRLQSFCFNDIPHGLFTDQRWADLVPAYFSDYQVLREPIYNVCTWNLTHRTVTGSLSDGLFVNGRRLAFYHFSGFDSGAQQSMLDRYGAAMPALYELREWYVNSCDEMDAEGFSGLPWKYDFFDNGERILDAHRKRYRATPSLHELFPDPFRSDPDPDSETYLLWFNLHEGDAINSGPIEMQSSDPPLPDYRILILAMGADVAFLPETCDRILQSTHNRSEIVIVTSANTVLGALPCAFQIFRLDATRYSDLFLRALEPFADRDLLFVRAGAELPAFWDLRLAWSAARQPGALSVAPLDRRVLDTSGVFAGLDQRTLDCYCYWYRRSSEEEAASLETDCVYIKASALRDIVGRRKPASIADLENQAALLRYTNLLATHLCVGWDVPRRTSDRLEVLGTNGWSIHQFRDTLRTHQVDSLACPIHAVTPGTSPTLHISHSWGGGVERWLSEFIEADHVTSNLVLKSEGPHGAYGTELALYRYRMGKAAEQLDKWSLKPRIKATDVRNESYAAVLRELVERYRFGKVLVSSLIGHSLECLKLPVPTAVVCHDYYPFCSAINLTFGEVCPSCEAPRLQACLEENAFNHSFPNVPVPEWLAIREEFVCLVNGREIPLVAPSPSVKENYSRALPEVAGRFRVIPHGTRPPSCKVTQTPYENDRPLRLLVLGSMAIHKGRLLLEAVLPELLQFAELTLAGCFDFPEQFLSNPRIRVIPSYNRESLCQLVEELRPDAGLLLSVVPEAFSYTLHELQSMGVPPVATRIGSFADWIRPGENGFLSDPQPAPLLDLLRSLSSDRSQLQRVHEGLQRFTLRSPEEMVRDYRALSEVRYSPAVYFNGPSAPAPLKGRGLQLYWRTQNEDFSERNSVMAFPRGSSRQTLRLDYVLPGSIPAQLRLDFGTRPGFVVLHRVALVGRKGETLWTTDLNLEELSDAQFVQSFVVNRTAGQGREIFLSLFGNDPHMILPIPAATLAQSNGAGTLEVDFTPGPETGISSEEQAAPSDNASLTLESAIDELGRAVARAHDELSAAQQQSAHVVQKMRAELAQRDQAINALQQSVSWKITKPLRTLAHAGRKAPNEDGEGPPQTSK